MCLTRKREATVLPPEVNCVVPKVGVPEVLELSVTAMFSSPRVR